MQHSVLYGVTVAFRCLVRSIIARRSSYVGMGSTLRHSLQIVPWNELLRNFNSKYCEHSRSGLLVGK